MQKDQSVSLGSPTFLGLLLAQFTATFNDQATHMVAVFFASDMLIRYVGSRLFDEKLTPAIVALAFMLPFCIFSPLAGLVADRFSKRTILVLWKVAEFLFMLLALAALSIPALCGPPGPSVPLAMLAGLMMIGTVLLMGLHSTFFVPAKYGIMPELLDHAHLSRGNGFLEGTSFMAQIFGTSAGGILYATCKSELYVRDGHKVLDPGREWIVGLMLAGLAFLGMATSLFMKPVPPAAPDKPVRWTWIGPLRENLKILVGAKPLLLALIGIGFVSFMTVFLRQTLLYDAELRAKAEVQERIDAGVQPEPRHSGERNRPHTMRERLREAFQEPELKVSLLIALVGFGVGLGSLTAGYLSGDRVELGLVPIGALAMIASVFPMSMLLNSTPALVVILFLLGLSAGFVVVPLYTQKQHRAPKEKKGNIIAASTFIYVCCGITAILLFYVAAWILERVSGTGLQAQMRVPPALIVLTGVFAMTMTAVLWMEQPDFPLRMAILLRRIGRPRVLVTGVEDLPLTPPVVLQARCASFLETLYLLSEVDRSTHLVIVEPQASSEDGLLRWLARCCGWCLLTDTASDADWDRAERLGRSALAHGHVAGIAVIASSTSPAASRASQMVTAWQAQSQAQLLEVGTQAV